MILRSAGRAWDLSGSRSGACTKLRSTIHLFLQVFNKRAENWSSASHSNEVGQACATGIQALCRGLLRRGRRRCRGGARCTLQL